MSRFEQRFLWMALTLLSVALTGCPGPRAELRSLDHDGLKRTYALFVPASWNADHPVPLVLALHGARGDARVMQYLTQFNPIADREGFLLAYPEGLDKQWNDGRNAVFGHPSHANVDDVGFIHELVDRLCAEYNVDRTRIYVTGVSNGAMMCHRLACELTGLFAAAAPVIGAMPEPLPDVCTPAAPMPMLLFNGTDDRLVPWDGGDVAGRPDYGRVLSVEATAQYWVANNGANPVPGLVDMPDTNPHDGAQALRETFAAAGESGGEVVLYRIDGGGHTWPGGARYQRPFLLGSVCRDLAASELIWQFFQAHTR